MATQTENPTAEKSLGNNTLDKAVTTTAKSDHAEHATAVVNSGNDGDKKENQESKNSVPVSPRGENQNAASATDVEKKIRRAERFGITVQLSEEEKRNSRAERFGTAPTPQGSDSSKKSEELKKTEELKKSEELKRKARAERFGIPQPPVKSEEEAKKKARLERFAPAPKTDALEEDKKKARALRFSQPSSGSLPLNGKGSVEPKEAIAGKAGGGS